MHSNQTCWSEFLKCFVSKLNLICTKLYSADVFSTALIFNFFIHVLTLFVDVVFGSLLCCLPLFFCEQKLPLIFTITVFLCSKSVCVAGLLSKCMSWGLAQNLDNMHSVLLILGFVRHFNICIYCLFKWCCIYYRLKCFRFFSLLWGQMNLLQTYHCLIEVMHLYA